MTEDLDEKYISRIINIESTNLFEQKDKLSMLLHLKSCSKIHFFFYQS
jgi:hypothetical protein